MHIMVLGLRGFPGIQGGVETHAEQLYPRLREMGCDIEVAVRSPYWSQATHGGIPGIRFSRLWCPRKNGAEAFVHSFLGVLYAGWKRPDVLHIHAIGPSLFAPLAKLLGLRVVVTHHGPDYDREKWGKTAKAVLRLGERMGVQYSDERIVISNVIRDIVKEKYRKGSFRIPNGVEIPKATAQGGTLAELGLTPERYILTVSRMVPEKRHLDLIDGFERARLSGWKLVLVGDLSAETPYVESVREAARHSDAVVLAGFQTGQPLADLFANAGLFVLPSTHEGLPIALLEALSHGLPAIASDIPANLEVGLDRDHYFRVGDPADLAKRLVEVSSEQRPSDYRMRVQEWVRSNYDWKDIARSTLGVYKRVRQNGWRQRLQMAWMPE
ncbi:glycosyltransferase family 4 protein [Thiorhodococcus minor]|uniref:Glycosyltransferase family 4 protein n=1 Tax=Thiorhodococcus minor TaxID=57489 RepID=A0A6M0JXG8_9GAMM|nr:glycosyltransferase family 4 protein [Thiorhodococcus minor]NEV62210.1 glycosyltransferase family 4 protein [Thiorhodococcus minor]